MAIKKKEALAFVALCIILAVIAIAGTIAAYYMQFTTTAIEFDAAAGNYIGINADTDILHFGTGYPGSILERSLRFYADKPAEIYITSNLQFAYPEIDKFTLKSGEERLVRMFISLPEGQIKNYTGKFIIRQKETGK